MWLQRIFESNHIINLCRTQSLTIFDLRRFIYPFFPCLPYHTLSSGPVQKVIYRHYIGIRQYRHYTQAPEAKLAMTAIRTELSPIIMLGTARGLSPIIWSTEEKGGTECWDYYYYNYNQLQLLLSSGALREKRNRMLRRRALCPDNFRRLRTYKAPALIWGSRSLAFSFSLWWRWSKAHDIEWRIAKTKKTTTTTSAKLHCGQVDQNNSGCGDTKMKVLVPSTSLRILQQRQDDEYGRCGESTYNFHREVWE